jgi:hypothetical protein
MSHREITIDNTRCKRRFHYAYDDASPRLPEQPLKCQLCSATITTLKDMPRVRFTRLENLVNQVDLSPLTTDSCDCRFE